MEWIVLGVLVALLFVFVRFTTIEEGTAKAITLFGQFSKIIFRWENHWMDEYWNIWRLGEEGSEGKRRGKVWSQKLFGGLTVYFWPFQKIYRYKHRWTDIRLQQTEMVVEFHEKELNHVLLKPAVYAFKLTAVETKPPERIPVDVLVLVTLRVQNPYLFLFVAPPTPIEDILARISAETRALVTSYSVDDLLQLRGASLWGLLKESKVIQTLEKWGIRLAEKGLEIQQIDLPPEYQKALAQKREQELKAAGRAEEIIGTAIVAVARAEGRPESDVQAEFRDNPQEFYQKHQRTIDNTITKLSMEEGAYLRIETPGAEGGLGDFLKLIGAWKRMPMGKPPEPKPTEPKPAEEEGPEKEIDRLVQKGELTKREWERLLKLIKQLPQPKKNEVSERIADLTIKKIVKVRG